MKIVDALGELVPSLVVVLEEALLAALVDLGQEVVDVVFQELLRLLVQPVGQRLRVGHANRVDIFKMKIKIQFCYIPKPRKCPWSRSGMPFSPVNLSFHTDLGTVLKVMTPEMVSFRVPHVWAKSTRFGFKDMVFAQI